MARFDQIPFFQGKKLTYYQYFALIGTYETLIISSILFTVYLILLLLQKYHQSYLSLKSLNNKLFLIKKAMSICFYSGFICLSLLPMIYQALDQIDLMTGISVQIIILLISVYLNIEIRQKKQNQINKTIPKNSDKNDTSEIRDQPQISCKSISKQNKKRIIICLLFSICANLITYKTCLSMFNTQTLFFSNFFGYDINTYVTRMLTVKQSCSVGGPCQMYTTIPQNPSEAIFLNLHTHVDVKSVDVYYQELLTPNVTDFKKVTADFFPYEGLERLARRNVHSALISGLKPSTKYLTKVFYNNRFWANAIFKTLPAPGDKKTPIRMINAGDFGYNKIAVNMSKIVSQLKPDVFFMGGDIAYDDNMPACAYTWDQFFAMYATITNQLGYLLPMAAGVGNHDVGINELLETNVTVNNEGPAFHIYLPQHFDSQNNDSIVEKVPLIENRRTFMNFTFGNVHYIVLDSGYLHGFDGYQKQFMTDSFEANKQKIKFVNYHVPIYSVCKGFDKDPTRLLLSIQHWVSQFDKYHVMASFENHVHSFKRTKPLVDGKPRQYGTVYLGDGGFSAFIQPTIGPEKGDDTFAAYANSNSFWLTEITQNKVQHWAYNNYGQIIDHLIQYPQNYTIGTVRGQYKPQTMQENKLENGRLIDQQSYLKLNPEPIGQKLPYVQYQKRLKAKQQSQISMNKQLIKHQFSIKRREYFHNIVTENKILQ